MPKYLIPAGWLEKPCEFICHEDAESTCGFCEGEFSFWNGARHCQFCGHLFHRRQCTSKVQVEGMFFRRRICPRCHYYRNVAAEKLKRGEEFVCMNGRGARRSSSSSSAVFISLSEETAELVLRWRANGVTETVDLLEVKTRKGFSHRGRLNSVGDYDPLRSLSLFVGDGFGGQRSFDIRASTAWSAQLWVDGLTAAHYVYQCMLEQNSASDSLSSNMTDKSLQWFNRTKYLPQAVPSNQSSPLSSPKSFDKQSQRYWSTSSSQSDSDNETTSTNSRQSTSVFTRSGYLSEQSPTPSFAPRKIHHSLPSHYRRSSHVPIKSRVSSSSTSSTPGLPYIHSPFSTICRCHAFEILPSRSVDLRSSEIEKKSFTMKPCCGLCRDACKIVVDMDNL